MRLPFQRTLTPALASTEARRISNDHLLGWIGVPVIVILSAILRFANLKFNRACQSLLHRRGNQHAPIRAQLFLRRGGTGRIGQRGQAAVGFVDSSHLRLLFGRQRISVVLPEILAGIFSVIVLYHLVRRSFGTMAGLLAALVLAITPIVIATDRNNTMDSTLILTLLLAAWAFIKATETKKIGYLLLGAALVGIGFNIKMLEAFLPLPAFYALYLLGSKEKIWNKLWKLGVASVLLLVISFSWATAVDLTRESTAICGQQRQQHRDEFDLWI